MVIQVKVTTSAPVRLLEEVAGGPWRARLKSAPVGGRANLELITLFARHFRFPKSAGSIRSGATGRLKLVEIKQG